MSLILGNGPAEPVAQVNPRFTEKRFKHNRPFVVPDRATPEFLKSLSHDSVDDILRLDNNIKIEGDDVKTAKTERLNRLHEVMTGVVPYVNELPPLMRVLYSYFETKEFTIYEFIDQLKKAGNSAIAFDTVKADLEKCVKMCLLVKTENVAKKRAMYKVCDLLEFEHQANKRMADLRIELEAISELFDVVSGQYPEILVMSGSKAQALEQILRLEQAMQERAKRNQTNEV